MAKRNKDGIRSDDNRSEKENLDPITHAPGAHPVGVGAGAASAGAAGAAIGGAIGGPIGAVVGAAIGAVSGGLGGKAAAEAVNPTIEDTYWRDNYGQRPYVKKEQSYDLYRPAYQYGWQARMMHGDRAWSEVEKDLETGWTASRGDSQMPWSDARHATRDAWERVGPPIGSKDKDRGEPH